MKHRMLWTLISVLLIASVLLAACGGAATTEAPAVEPTKERCSQLRRRQPTATTSPEPTATTAPGTHRRPDGGLPGWSGDRRRA